MSLKLFQIAKQLGVDSTVIIRKCKDEGVPGIESHMSPVSAGLAATIREWFATRKLAETHVPAAQLPPLISAAPSKRQDVPVPTEPASTGHKLNEMQIRDNPPPVQESFVERGPRRPLSANVGRGPLDNETYKLMLKTLGGPGLNANDVRFLIDTSSLMALDAEQFFNRFISAWAQNTKAPAAIPSKVMAEVEKHCRAPSSVETVERTERAHTARQLVQQMRDANIVDVYGGSEESFADNVMQMVIVRFRIKYHLWLVTQDGALAADALRLNNAASVQTTRTIRAFRVGTNGTLQQWALQPSGIASYTPLIGPIASMSAPDVSSFKLPNIMEIPFRLMQGLPRSDLQLIKVSLIPNEGDIILSPDKRPHRLVQRLGAGGEGRVFLTDTGLVTKVYASERLTTGLKAKIELMTARPIADSRVCWPSTLALNAQGEFVGYMMAIAEGREIQRTIFVKPLLTQYFPHWTRVELVTLAVTILRAIHALHSSNVVLGDINPMNILVQNESSVFLVDTDSYQIEDFACPVGMPSFVAPELLGKDLPKVLRTFDHEYFAVATLVFMILMPGKPPYSHAGGSDPAENVRRGHFPYPLGEKKGQGVPIGPWRFIWSHFPRYIKEAFHRVFSDKKRPSTAEWIALLERYINDLQAQFFSHEIFPSDFRALNKEETLKYGGTWRCCQECGGQYGDMRNDPTPVCPKCLSKIEANCPLCKQMFQLTRAFSARLAGNALCPRCYAKVTTLVCKDCDLQFKFTGKDELYFQQRGLLTPKRCPECRERRKAEQR